MVLLLTSLAWALPDVSEARLEADLRVLVGRDPTGAGDHIVSRSIFHPGVDLAATWLVQAFVDAGVEPRLHAFEAAGEAGLVNIVVDLPGVEPELPLLVVAAHYDSTASLSEGWEASLDPAPGADDDASGVVVLLELARLLQDVPRRRSVRLVAFSAEEVGLVGSELYVEELVERGEDVHLALVLDPVGYNPGDVLWFVWNAASEAEALELQAAGALVDGLDVLGVDEALIGGDQRSDHAPFWAAGFPALHLGSYPQPPSYHTLEDELEVVDTAFLAKVASVTFQHVVALADPVEEADAIGCGAAFGVWWLALVPLARRRA